MKRTIAIAALGFVVISCGKELVRQREVIQKLSNYSEYLANKLDEHDVPMTEFDILACNAIVD